MMHNHPTSPQVTLEMYVQTEVEMTANDKEILRLPGLPPAATTQHTLCNPC